MLNLTTIGNGAFRSTPLEQLGDMPKLTTIGEEAFANCRNLSVVHLPKTLKHVGKNAFKYVRNLGQLTSNLAPTLFVNAFISRKSSQKITDVRVENAYRIKHSMNDVKKAAQEDNGSDTERVTSEFAG